MQLVVSDRGVGIPDDQLEQVFEPFVTFRDQGLGLGLAISRSIVSAHRARSGRRTTPTVARPSAASCRLPTPQPCSKRCSVGAVINGAANPPREPSSDGLFSVAERPVETDCRFRCPDTGRHRRGVLDWLCQRPREPARSSERNLMGQQRSKPRWSRTILRSARNEVLTMSASRVRDGAARELLAAYRQLAQRTVTRRCRRRSDGSTVTSSSRHWRNAWRSRLPKTACCQRRPPAGICTTTTSRLGRSRTATNGESLRHRHERIRTGRRPAAAGSFRPTSID